MGDSPFARHPPDIFPKVYKEENKEVYEQHRSRENTGNDSNAISLNPSENGKSQTE